MGRWSRAAGENAQRHPKPVLACALLPGPAKAPGLRERGADGTRSRLKMTLRSQVACAEWRGRLRRQQLLTFRLLGRWQMRPNGAGIRTAGPGLPGERARGPDARAPTRGCPRVLAASAHTAVCFPLGSPAKSCGGSGPAEGRSIRNAHEKLFGPHPQASIQIVLVPCAAHSQARPRAPPSLPAAPPPGALSISASALPPPCALRALPVHPSGPPRRLWRPRPGKAPPGQMPQLRWIIPSLHHLGRCSGVAVCLPYQGSSGAGWPPAGWGSPAVVPGETLTVDTHCL